MFLTCFIHYYLIGMDLSGSILLNSGSFASNLWEIIKMQF